MAGCTWDLATGNDALSYSNVGREGAVEAEEGLWGCMTEDFASKITSDPRG